MFATPFARRQKYLTELDVSSEKTSRSTISFVWHIDPFPSIRLFGLQDSILKSRDITLPTKVHLVKDMVFPLVTYGCESWTIKKAEH